MSYNDEGENNRKGKLLQFSTEQMRWIKDYGQIHDFWIWRIMIDKFDTYLFTIDDQNFMKQWTIRNQKLQKNWGKLGDIEIRNVKSSGNYMYMLDTTKTLTVYDIVEGSLYGTYRNIVRSKFKCWGIVHDSLFVQDEDGHLKELFIDKKNKKMSILKNHGTVLPVSEKFRKMIKFSCM